MEREEGREEGANERTTAGRAARNERRAGMEERRNDGRQAERKEGGNDVTKEGKKELVKEWTQ